MNKIATLLAPLALAAATLVPNFANAATMPAAAPVSAQVVTVAKWGREGRREHGYRGGFEVGFRQPAPVFYGHYDHYRGRGFEGGHGYGYGFHGERGGRRW